MSAEKTEAGTKTIAWPSVITVLSAAILIGAEVFGAAFAGGWALAILFAIGAAIMVGFVRGARQVEPFTRRV